MRLNISELIHAAYHAARYLPKASSQLIRDLAERLDTTQAALCESLKIRDALAAENSALKSAHPQPFGPEMMKALDAYEKYQDEVPETGMLDAFFILRDSIRVTTPNTDAWVNEQRAVGATRVETNLRACYEEFPESSRDIVDECIQIAANAAAQLRGSQV